MLYSLWKLRSMTLIVFMMSRKLHAEEFVLNPNGGSKMKQPTLQSSKCLVHANVCTLASSCTTIREPTVLSIDQRQNKQTSWKKCC